MGREGGAEQSRGGPAASSQWCGTPLLLLITAAGLAQGLAGKQVKLRLFRWNLSHRIPAAAAREQP